MTAASLPAISATRLVTAALSAAAAAIGKKTATILSTTAIAPAGIGLLLRSRSVLRRLRVLRLVAPIVIVAAATITITMITIVIPVPAPVTAAIATVAVIAIAAIRHIGAAIIAVRGIVILLIINAAAATTVIVAVIIIIGAAAKQDQARAGHQAGNQSMAFHCRLHDRRFFRSLQHLKARMNGA